jgi:hypothetical protein
VFDAERWQLILLSASVTIEVVSLIAIVLLIVRHGAWLRPTPDKIPLRLLK